MADVIVHRKIQKELDERGRIIIPKWMKEMLDWRTDDIIEISIVEPLFSDEVEHIRLVNLSRQARKEDGEEEPSKPYDPTFGGTLKPEEEEEERS